MDRLLYVAMNGAKSMFDRQNQVAHNLANVSTAGYRAETMAFRALPVEGPGRHTRTFVVDSTTGTDFSIGPMRETGRVFDVALDGKGFIAVRGADGKEAYTRDGALQLGRNGVLETKNGLQVLTDAGGTIVIPPMPTVSALAACAAAAVCDAPPATPAKNPGQIVAASEYKYAAPVPIATSVSMFALRCLTPFHAERKNWAPHHTMTGVVSASWSQLIQGTLNASIFPCDMAMISTGSDRAAPTMVLVRRRLASASPTFMCAE